MTIRHEGDYEGWASERANEIAERTRPYETRTVVVEAEDGARLAITVPANIPTQDRAEKLRRLWDRHVRVLDARIGWRGPVEAIVSESVVGDVEEAMAFMGAIVDRIEPKGDGTVRLYSNGYFAHGF